MSKLERIDRKLLIIVTVIFFYFLSSTIAEEIKITTHTKAHTTTTSRKRLGYIEKIKLLPENILIDAKLTPSLNENSMHAEDIKELKVKNKTWVTFSTVDKTGNKIELKRKVVSKKIINNKNYYTVDISFCIDNKILKIEFALKNRSRFSTHVKIGRDALAGLYLIDPGSTRISKPICEN